MTTNEARVLPQAEETPEEVAVRAMQEGDALTEEILVLVAETVKQYRTGADPAAAQLCLQIAESLDCLLKITDWSAKLLNLDLRHFSCGGKTINGFLEQVNGVLVQVVAAQERRDGVHLADLLEYELAPLLDQWKRLYPALREASVR